MTRRSGGFRGAKPTWTTTSTSGIFGMEDVVELKAAGQWPRGPVAPTSLAGTPGDQQVALTWVAPATTHGTITDYLVEYTPAAGSPTVVATGSTAASYTLTGLTNDTEYTIRVAGVNHTRGDWSDSVAGTPSAAPIDPDFASVLLLATMESDFSDSSSNGITPVITGSPAIQQSNNLGGGYAALNGQTGSIAYSIPGNALSQWTMEFWYRSANPSQAYLVLDFGNNGNIATWQYLNPFNTPNTLDVWFSNFAKQHRQSDLVLNQWYHYAAVYDNGSLYYYIDGSPVLSTTTTISTAPTIVRLGRPTDNSHAASQFHNVRLSSIVRYPGGATFTPPTASFPVQ